MRSPDFKGERLCLRAKLSSSQAHSPAQATRIMLIHNLPPPGPTELPCTRGKDGTLQYAIAPTPCRWGPRTGDRRSQKPTSRSILGGDILARKSSNRWHPGPCESPSWEAGTYERSPRELTRAESAELSPPSRYARSWASRALRSTRRRWRPRPPPLPSAELGNRML